MKSSEVAIDQQQQVSQLMHKHDKRRSYQVDWQKTKINIGGFFGRDNDPLREISRTERRRRSDGRAVAFDEDAVELADLLNGLMNQKKRSRSYISDGACGRACAIRDGKSRIQLMSEHLRRTGQLPPGRSYAEFSSTIR